MIGERWKEIYPGYWLSHLGHWYSVRSHKLLKPQLNSSGYERVMVYIDHRQKRVLTHIKVIVAFGDCNGRRIPKDCESLRALRLSIDHIDRDKHHNTIKNLEIVTHVENCRRRDMSKREVYNDLE